MNIPSLEDLAAAKLSKQLWKHKISRESDCGEERVLGKIRHLNLPKSLNQKISILIRKQYSDYLRWYTEVNENCALFSGGMKFLNPIVLRNITWTDTGTVNCIKTAKRVIGSPLLANNDRYVIACLYCLADLITVLAAKVNFQRDGDVNPFFQPLVFFWTCCITNDMNRLNRLPTLMNHTNDGYQLSLSPDDIVKLEPDWQLDLEVRYPPAPGQNLQLVSHGPVDSFNAMIRYMLQITCKLNEYAFTYFWKQLDSEYRNGVVYDVLVQTEQIRYMQSVVTHLSQQQQREFFRIHGDRMLCYYLQNPLNVDYVLDMVSRFRYTLTVEKLQRIIMGLLENMNMFEMRTAQSTYLHVVKQIWVRIPQSLRIKTFETARDFLVAWSQKFDLHTNAFMLKIMLEEADDEYVERILNSQYGKYICSELKRKNEPRILELLVPTRSQAV